MARLLTRSEGALLVSEYRAGRARREHPGMSVINQRRNARDTRTPADGTRAGIQELRDRLNARRQPCRGRQAHQPHLRRAQPRRRRHRPRAGPRCPDLPAGIAMRCAGITRRERGRITAATGRTPAHRLAADPAPRARRSVRRALRHPSSGRCCSLSLRRSAVRRRVRIRSPQWAPRSWMVLRPNRHPAHSRRTPPTRPSS
jgi:hypothetical protein